MAIEDTPEWQLSIKMRPACNKIYREVFGVDDSAIERFNKDSDLFVLDKEFHIDLRIKLKNGSQVTGQEKTLSNCFYKYKTFTMEFYQNRYTKEKGEFFKIASQFYLHGYGNKTNDDFEDWYILDILRVVDWLKKCGEDELAKKTKPSGGSRACFLPIQYDKIPREFILTKQNSANRESPIVAKSKSNIPEGFLFNPEEYLK